MILEGDFENLVIGSGPSAFAAAFALRRLGKRFTVLDVGFQLEDSRRDKSASLSRTSVDDWPLEIQKELFPLPKTVKKGVERRLALGSMFPYKVPEEERLECDNCSVERSYAKGGFGNVWGAAVLPFSDAELADWPVSSADMRMAYRRISEYVPMMARVDQLAQEFPLDKDDLGEPPTSPIGENLTAIFERRKFGGPPGRLLWGKARLAVEDRPSAYRCRQCGYCLDGCVFGSIFNPGHRWEQLGISDIQYRPGVLVQSLKKVDGTIRVQALNLKTGQPASYRAQRVFWVAAR